MQQGEDAFVKFAKEELEFLVKIEKIREEERDYEYEIKNTEDPDEVEKYKEEYNEWYATQTLKVKNL